MKKNNLTTFLEKIEGKTLLSDKFHSASNNKKACKTEIVNPPESWIRIHFKTYPRLNRIFLSLKTIQGSKLYKIMKDRRSVRKFSNLPISKEQLSYILFASCGLITKEKNLNNSRRPYPSAGARYPLEVYSLILNCNGIKKGLYHYNVLENSLECLLKSDLKNWIIRVTNNQNWIADAAIIFIITGVLIRTRIKYSDRGYRFALIESGHLAQNICLLTTELGLGSCAIGGYIDEEVDKLLDIELQKEFTLYLIAVGKK